MFASAYIAIDVSERWPTDADFREIAKHASQSVTRLDITKQEIYEFLSYIALGAEKPEDVFSVEGTATVPLYATANLLLKIGREDPGGQGVVGVPGPDLGRRRNHRPHPAPRPQAISGHPSQTVSRQAAVRRVSRNSRRPR